MDIAGTTDFRTPFVVAGFERPRERLISPQDAKLEIAYPALPALPAIANQNTHEIHEIKEPEPRLELHLEPGVEIEAGEPPKEREINTGDEFIIRIVRERTVPSGAYGADALTEAKNRRHGGSIRMRYRIRRPGILQGGIKIYGAQTRHS